MTTLPQTAGARYPRAGARAASIPALAQPAAGASSAANSLTFSDVIRILRANIFWIILITLLALVIGFLINQFVLLKYFKKYTAESLLQVQLDSVIDTENKSQSLAMDKSVLEIRQKTLANKLSSKYLIRSVLSNDQGALAKSGWMGEFRENGALNIDEAVDEVQDSLSVDPRQDTELIVVRLSAPTPEDAQMGLEAIVTRLLDTEKQDATSSTTTDRKGWDQMRIRNDLAWSNAKNDMDKYAGRTGIVSGGGSPTGGSSSSGAGVTELLRLEIQELVAKRIELQNDFTEATNEYDNFAKTLEAGGTPAELDMRITQDPTIQRLESDIDGLDTDIISAAENYGEESRQVRSAKAALNAKRAKLESKKEELRVQLGSQYRERLQNVANTVKQKFDIATKQLEDLQKRHGEATQDLLAYNNSKELFDYYTKRRQDIQERLDVIAVNPERDLKRRGSVSSIGNVEKPKELSFPDLRMTLAAAGLGGLCLSLGIAFMRELMDSSVRNPRDIAKVGQLNLLGMIPHVDEDPQAAAGELSLAISQVPHSIIAENFRQVRTRLQHAASLDTTRSLLVTSPGPGDGKTTVACNIAAGLALNGRKILLVDANFRRPDLHKVFGLGNERGLGNVLTQQSGYESVAQKTSVPNLTVLTTGPRPANATELLESQLLTDFIDRALEEYDHVIFDAGPILLVSETVALAPRVDGVISVVRAKSNSRGVLQRMRDALRQLKAEHLGVVLNGVRQHTGGYYAKNIKNYYAYQNESN